jgi:hypothetical protein
MNKNLIPIIFLALIFAGASHMLYKSFQLRAAIQRTSISLTNLELSLDRIDCALRQGHPEDEGEDHDND